MSSTTAAIQTNDQTAAAIDLLRRWLKRAVFAEAMQWLDSEIDRQRTAPDERRLGIAIGLAGRRIAHAQLSLSAAGLAVAQVLRPRWQPDTWSAEEAARVAIWLATWRGDEERFADLVDRLCATGELNEHVACLKGFAVFPAPGRLLTRARSAVRSSAQPVFEAMACHNPYPTDYFNDDAFNHMVVKCVFSGVSIAAVVGLDERRNEKLVRMMRDLVSERQSASRPVPERVHRWIAGKE
jgi:hypothetical protein